MVLLTASTISTIVSGGVICAFTFLLFLSGYVLQQQTVKSLQDALRNPPDRISIPTPSLPAYFQADQNEETHLGLGVTDQVVLVKSSSDYARYSLAEKSLRLLWQDYMSGSNAALANDQVLDLLEATNSSDIDNLTPITSTESLAYIFTLADIDSLCSAVLFAKRHKEVTRLKMPAGMVFLYPATWDVSDQDDHLAAMDVLRDMQDNFSVTLHPVTISRVWAGITVQQQLLAELQRYRWPYQRALYLASPGIAIDTSILDEALALSDKSAWTLLHPKPKSHEASHPTMLFWAAGRGLLYPRHDTKTLIARVTIPRNQRPGKKQVAEDVSLNGYILFDEEDMGQGYRDNLSLNNLINRYVADRRAACAVVRSTDV